MQRSPTLRPDTWLNLVAEEIVEPERPIIDPHHHLWDVPLRFGAYTLADLKADTASGHNIVKTVFVECRASYRQDGPAHLRPVGETEFVAAQAARSDGLIAGIVGHADLSAGDALAETLAAHEAAAGGRLRGIRHAGAHDSTGTLWLAGPRAPCPYGEADFRAGVRTLGRHGLCYDTWHFFHQNRDFLALARAVPGTTMVLDHFGTPLGAGAYAGKQEEIFAGWREDIAAIAECPNVVAKLGGLAMPDNGFGWHERERPPTSDEFVAAQRRYYLHTIECFGPERCMFESNFPMDKLSISYPVLWNGMKKLVRDFSEHEKRAMFHDVAARTYRL